MALRLTEDGQGHWSQDGDAAFCRLSLMGHHDPQQEIICGICRGNENHLVTEADVFLQCRRINGSGCAFKESLQSKSLLMGGPGRWGEMLVDALEAREIGLTQKR